MAEIDGEPAGMVDAFIDKFREEKKGFIQMLAVLPKFRHKGVARKLFEEALKSLRQREMTVAEAWTRSDKQACIHIYESFGFKPVRIISMMRRTLENLPGNIGENTEASIKEVALNNEENLKLLNKLDNEAFKEHFNFRPRTVEETRYALLENPWFSKQEWFIAFLDEQPAGFVGAVIDEELNKEKKLRWGWIYDVGVLKSYRRKGIGARLMLHAMQRLKHYGMADIVLYVDEMNPTKAIKLYEKLGFKTLYKGITYQRTLNSGR
ncbi:MAG: GNAT family N-acetyltransferase [Candidatus Bathyarchaeia archaeon]